MTLRSGMIMLALLTAHPPAVAVATTITQSTLIGEASIRSRGLLLGADNLAGPTTTINGIEFDEQEEGDLLTVGTLSGFTDAAFNDFSGSFPPGSPLDFVLNTLYFQAGATGLLQLTGLTSDHDYRVQLLMQNNVNATGKNARITVNGMTLNLNDFGSSPALVTIEFTATGPTQNLSFGTGSEAAVERAILNGIALHDLTLPEPASLALLAVGAAAIIRRRAV